MVRLPALWELFTFDRLNITGSPSRTQALFALGAAALLASCAQGGSTVTPASPETAVRGFLDAVRDNNLDAMADRWGDQRGPARSYMPASELTQRLTVIRAYLQHERAELLESQAGVAVSEANQRTIQVRLTRNGCTPVVPFTLLRFRSGWLISNIDIAAAGNPARRCAPPAGEAGRGKGEG